MSTGRFAKAIPLAESGRPPIAYSAGLTGVLAAVIFLPVIFTCIICGLAWLAYRHLTDHIHWISGNQAGWGLGGLYVVFTVILGTTLYFLVRPVIFIRFRQKVDTQLFPEAEPWLFAFVRDICMALGAPVPIRIYVNMDVNASARFAHGLTDIRRRNLELILGLPLVRGLDLGQFAAVLAHEFGHFRQISAMRLVHTIRSMNQWFAEASGYEDDWEEDLLRIDFHEVPILLLPVWGCAKALLWIVRKVFWLQMRAGQAVSCMLLRQMEFEADRAAIRMVGANTFADMILEAKVLEAAWGLANRSLGMALREGRLADDLPALVSAHTRVFIPAVRRKMERGLLEEKTAWFDTHPSLAERITRARQSTARGMFHAKGMAHTLFSDFESLSIQATHAYYLHDLGDEFNPARMISTSDLVTGQSEIQVGEAAVSGYFLGLLSNLRPIWITNSDLQTDFSGVRLREMLREARTEIETGILRAVDLYHAYTTSDAKILDSLQALTLMQADFWVEPGDFQMKLGGSAQASLAFRSAEADQITIGGELDGFERAMRKRLISALGLLLDPDVGHGLQDAHASSIEVLRLLPGLEAMEKVHGQLESLRRTCYSMSILLENQVGNEKNGELHGQLQSKALAIRIHLETLREGLHGYEYPFGAHSNGTGLAGYALDALPPEHDLQAHYLAAEEVLGRCYAFYFRVIGRLALAAGRVEGVLGLGPLQVERRD